MKLSHLLLLLLSFVRVMTSAQGEVKNEYFDKPSKKKRKWRKRIERYFPFMRIFFKKN